MAASTAYYPVGDAWFGLETTLIIQFRCEGANVRMKAIGCSKEDALIRRHGGVAIKQVR
jgi:hypothetical protein